MNKEVRESANHDTDGPGMAKPITEQRGGEGHHVYWEAPHGPGPSNPRNEERGKQSSQVYTVVNFTQRESYAGKIESFMINSIALWSKVMEELKGIRRDLAGKRSRKNSTSESSSENNDDRKQKSRQRELTTSDSSSDEDRHSDRPESSSESDGKERRRPKRSRKHSATETSSYDGDKETYRSKRRNRKSERNRSRSRRPPQDVDKKMLLEVMQKLQVKIPQLNSSSPEEYWAFRSRSDQEILHSSMPSQVKLDHLFVLCDEKAEVHRPLYENVEEGGLEDSTENPRRKVWRYRFIHEEHRVKVNKWVTREGG